MAVNWSNPTLANLWADFLTYLKARDESAAKMDYTGDTNLPTGVIRWNTGNNRFERWSGAAWVAITPDLTSMTGILPAAHVNDTTHGSRGGGTLHPAVTGSVNGFMIAADKTKLDNAVSAATASRLMIRDASGRAKVAAPSATDDIARKLEVDAVQTNLNTHDGLTAAGTHGSTSAATANTLMHRDASGRAKVATPSAVDDIARKDYVDTAVAGAVAAAFTTGDVKLTIKTVADSGWVLMNDGTIGSASSGATTRAHADTQALFELLWNNTTNANCAVSGGRGATGAADFAANKTLALPKALGRALAVYGAGAGLTARTMAQALGSENAIVVQHNHAITDPGHGHPVPNYVSPPSGASSGVAGISTGDNANRPSTPTDASVVSAGITINNSGSSGTGANMQPSVFLNVMIKL